MCRKRLFKRYLHSNYDGHAGTIFTRVQTKFKAQKALWYMASPNEATLRGRSIISTTHRPKKIGVAETANSENIFKRFHSSDMGDPLTFHVVQKSNTEAPHLTFIRCNTRFFASVCFAYIYPELEEVRLFYVEASARGMTRTAGVFLKFDPLRIWAVRLVDSRITH